MFEQKKRKPVFLWIGIISLVVIAAVVISVYVISKSSNENTYDDKLDLGRKYLMELNYEQAAIAFEEAIKIDPKRKDAYIELAEVYVKNGEPEKAVEILEEATDILDSENDKEKIETKKTEIVKTGGFSGSNKTGDKPYDIPEITEEPGTAPQSTSTVTPTSLPTPTSAPFINGKVGDIISFGSYEQDNNISNGKEAIEWIVLSNDGEKMLLLSKYALDCKPYNDKNEDVTWENCSIRNWLNDSFYKIAFNSVEKELISKTKLINKDNLEVGTKGGNDTNDKVFLLSLDDTTKYGFNSKFDEFDIKRRCSATAYAQAQGVWTTEWNCNYEWFVNNYPTEEGGYTCEWWLRSPGCRANAAARLSYSGCVDTYGEGAEGVGGVFETYIGVRPVIYLSLKGGQL